MVRLIGPFFDKKLKNENFPAIRSQILEAVMKGVYSPNVYPTLKSAFQQFLSMAYDVDTSKDSSNLCSIFANLSLRWSIEAGEFEPGP